MSALLRYRGVDRRGRARGGASYESPAELVERMWDARWQSLSVHRDGDPVNPVGSIEPDRTTGQRTSWSETTTGEDT